MLPSASITPLVTIHSLPNLITLSGGGWSMGFLSSSWENTTNTIDIIQYAAPDSQGMTDVRSCLSTITATGTPVRDHFSVTTVAKSWKLPEMRPNGTATLPRRSRGD